MTEDLLKNASIESAQEVENVQTSENPTQIESANETSAPQNQNDGKPTQPKKKFQLGDVAKCTIVLTVIALVAGLLLGIVNWVTYVDPDGVIADKCTAAFGSETSVKDEKLASYDYDKNNYVESCFVAKNGEEIVGYCYYTVGGGAKDGCLSCPPQMTVGLRTGCPAACSFSRNAASAASAAQVRVGLESMELL